MLLAAALHAACASPEPGAAGAGVSGDDVSAPASPSVWSASRADAGRVYLMGSVHLGPAAPLDLGPAPARAWDEAAELVLEVDFGRYDESDTLALLRRYGRVSEPDTLRDRLEPATWALLASYLEARGLPEQTFLSYEPWFVTTLVTVMEFRAIGYDPEHGVDRVLLDRARGDKTVAALESLESQFALLSGLPREAQDLMLRDVLERAEELSSEARRVVAAWRRGDDAALTEIVFRQIGQPELAAFYDSILFGRNRRMAEEIERLARDGRTRLVVVGVAHMLGDRGIPALLERRGFEVRKL